MCVALDTHLLLGQHPHSRRTPWLSVQVFAQLEKDLNAVHAMWPSEPLAAKKHLSPRCQDDVAMQNIEAFVAKHANGPSVRLNCIATHAEPYKAASRALLPTSWTKTRLPVFGMYPIDMTDRDTMRRVTKLCTQTKLRPPKAFVKKHAHHYGRYEGETLVSVLSLSVLNLNNTPGSIAVFVDLAASIDNTHLMSAAIDSIKKLLRKRRNLCVLFTQCAQTDVARAFWSGKLTNTKRASVMTLLTAMFDHRFLIYDDTDDMAIFFE